MKSGNPKNVASRVSFAQNCDIPLPSPRVGTLSSASGLHNLNVGPLVLLVRQYAIRVSRIMHV